MVTIVAIAFAYFVNMKTLFFIFIFCLLGFLAFVPDDEASFIDHQTMKEDMKMIIKVGDKAFSATVFDNPTSRDFMSLLPLTTKLEDYAGIEKIFYPDRKLSTQDSPDGFDPSVGDITYYAPWGDIAIFYKDFGYAKSLISIGHIADISGFLEALASTSSVTFEKEK